MYCMHDWSHRQYFICTVCMIDPTGNISYVLYAWLIPQAIFHMYYMYDWSHRQYFICTVCMIDPTGNISCLYVWLIPQAIFHMYCMYDWSHSQYFICTVCMIDPTGNISYVLSDSHEWHIVPLICDQSHNRKPVYYMITQHLVHTNMMSSRHGTLAV